MSADRSPSGPGRRRRSLPFRTTDVVEAMTSVLLGVLGIVGLCAAILLGAAVHDRSGARPPHPHPTGRWSHPLVDQGDHLATPGSPVASAALACCAVVLALAGVLAVLWLTWRLVARGTAARNAQRWAREWADVEPGWSGLDPRRPGGPGSRS